MEVNAALKSVLAAPADEAPRLVYADALLEAGDPMGEFLRLECAQGSSNTRERQRAQDLLIMNWRRWLGPLSLIVQRRASRFDRGFVQAAALAFPRRQALTAAQLAEIAACPLWQLVQSIELIGATTPEQVAAVLASPHLTRLESLTASVAELEAITPQPAFTLKQLVVTRGPGPLRPSRGWKSLTSLQLNTESISREWLQQNQPRTPAHRALVARLKRELLALISPEVLSSAATVSFGANAEAWPGAELSQWALAP